MKIVEHFEGTLPPPSERELISVVVAVYNIEAYVERCVRSIMAQTYPELEILLVDDGSTDAGGKLCDALAEQDARIRVLHKTNGGLSDARNAGTEAASGSLIAFVDGDDWLEPDMYGRMYAAMRAFGAPLAVCRYKQVYKDRVIDGSTDRAVLLSGSEPLEQFIAENDEVPLRNAAWNKLYRRELMGELRFPVGKLYEDIVYTTRLLERAKSCVYLDKAGYNYVLEREGSIMGKGLGERIFTDQVPAYQEKETFLRDIGRPDLADMHRFFYYKRLLNDYNLCMRSRDKRQRAYCGRLRSLILEKKEEMGRVYGCPAAGENDWIKMRMFVRSPLLYRLMTELNEGILLPLKRKRTERRERQ